MDSTPGSKSQKSFATFGSMDQAPATPKLPFDPPRRRSSLAFSKLIESPQSNVDDESLAAAGSDFPINTPLLHPVTRQTRTLETPVRYSGVLPGHVAQVQKVFQTARANLQFDMHFAASPIGSIDARLPQTDEDTSSLQEHNAQPRSSEKPWRYSTIPKLFSTTNMDVREPMPETSPPLPTIGTGQPGDINSLLAVEPTSSGFASPASGPCSSIDTIEMTLPPLPRSSSSGDIACYVEAEDHDVLKSGCEGTIPDLMEPMTGLKVGSDAHMYEDALSDRMDDSPTVDHLRRKSDGDCDFHDCLPPLPDTIFLSQSAKAAAESAIAKRELLKQAIDSIAIKEHTRSGKGCPDPSAHRNANLNCPNPDLHRYIVSTPCPDPFAHHQTRMHDEMYHSSDLVRAQPRAWGNEHLAPRSNDVLQSNSLQPRRRTTAAGSPMPFAKRSFSPPFSTDDTHMPQPRWLSSPPRRMNGEMFGSLPYAAQHKQKPSEHFRPGWQYPSRPVGHSTRRPVMNLYSFSTAAAKATGESAAPDLRIRDSYRTDTLTPLALPPGRFRRNGLGAALQASRPKKHHHEHGMAPRLITSRDSTRQQKDETLEYQGLQTRSSPPLPSSRTTLSQNTRKRGFADAVMPEFNVSEDGSLVSYDRDMRLRPSEEVMQVDDESRAAVRMSGSGPNTPEYFHGAREGIRELSPNVNIWRKGLQAVPHYRKKRRPSYWDGDLVEVKMSPAGRGKIVSSPPLSKRSMVAELDTMSNQTETVTADNDEREIEVKNLGALDDENDIVATTEHDANRSDAFEMEA